MAEAESSILIVDDDREDLAALEKALASLGCELHTVTDPHDVLPAAYRETPDVVVLDALLPGLSGFDLCKQIKTDGELKGTQVIIITGVYLRQQYRQEALQQFKADGFLTKPFRAPELQRLVVELLARKTRRPQSSFLSRLGLPSAAPSGRKRGLLGRLFGKEESAPTRIAPVSRSRPGELPESKAGAVASAEPESESKPETANGDTSSTLPGASASSTADAPTSETDTVGSSTIPLPAALDVSEPPAAVEKEPDEPEKAEKADKADEPEEIEKSKEPEEPEEKAEGEKELRASEEAAPSEATVDAPADSAAESPGVREPESVEPASVEGETRSEPEPAEVEASATEVLSTGDDVEEKRAPIQLPAPSEPAQPVAATSADAKLGDDRAKREAVNEHSPEAERMETQPAPTQAAEELDAAPAPSENNIEWKSQPPPTPAEPAASSAPGADVPSAPDPASDPAPDPKTESVAPARSPVAVRRPKFRVGDVPIYDEEDFHSELKRELSKCRRVDRPLTLILIQVNDLGQIVELFGEEVREAVLWHVAEQAMSSLREVDLVGMMGSKDLIALTAFASDKYGGGRVVARMRKSLDKNPFPVGGELPPIVPALQFGMSSYPDDGDDVVGLIAKAYEDIEG